MNTPPESILISGYSLAVALAVRQVTAVSLERCRGEMVMVDIKVHNHSLGSFAGVSQEAASTALLSVGPTLVCGVFTLYGCS